MDDPIPESRLLGEFVVEVECVRVTRRFGELSDVVVLIGGAVLKRTNRISPTVALCGVFAGIVITALGVVFFEGLSPDSTYTASSMPFPRSWYQSLALSVGLLITVVSFVVGWLRWPARPRYTFLGILMGLWISYPYLIPRPASDSHPLGYAIVVGTLLLVGYTVWKDTGDILREVLRDPVDRRFGIGVGVVLALFFVSVTAYLSFFPEEGIPHEVTVVVLPTLYQLVTWPTLEIAIPRIPFFLAVSPGQIIIVGTLSALIGLNAALIARHWRDARMDRDRYNRRSMNKTVFSSIKRTLGAAVRARHWWL